jgi:transcriptional regulator with XRE-family HTH domain
MSLREVLSANLSRLCEGEVSIAAVCRATRINRQQFNRYLSGASIPNGRNLEKICRYFRTDETELFRPRYEDAPGAPGDADPEAWSHGDVRATLKRLRGESPTSIEPGIYFAHFAYQQDPSMIMRSAVIVRRDGNLSTFRRLTGFSESKGSFWSHFTGDHQGIILERRHWLYFVGLNSLAHHEPTLFVLRWVPSAEPMLAGHANILTPAGPMVTAIVLSSCGPRMTLRSAVRASHVYSSSDGRIDPMVIDALDQQSQALGAMIRPIDLTVTPQSRERAT